MWVYVGAIVKSSVYLKFGPTTAFTLLFSIVVMKEQSCPGHGLWEQCDHGPAGGVVRGELC